MLPRHQPPFTLPELLRMLARPSGGAERVERRIEELLDVPHAVLLPSARFGIWAGLRIALPPRSDVAVPALTCSVVHEAVFRSGARPILLDCAEDSFLVDPGSSDAPGVVLCELYGNTFPAGSEGSREGFRIFDMAMCVPTAALCCRVRSSDLGVFSFGTGKALYSGGGGLAITRSDSLAAELRRMLPRDGGSLLDATRALVEVGARTVAHWPLLYPHLRRAKMRHDEAAGPAAAASVQDARPGSAGSGREWTAALNGIQLRLVDRALGQLADWHQVRIGQEQWYRTVLGGIHGVVLPPRSLGALSHFTIRVPAERRHALRASLWSIGVDTGTLFGFPRWASTAALPRARRVASEVLNLPLGRGLTLRIVHTIGGAVRDAMVAPLPR